LGEALTEEEFNILKEEFDVDDEGNINYIELAQKIFEE
jgi:Ca2+-binding EF-hand superfamily protein